MTGRIVCDVAPLAMLLSKLASDPERVFDVYEIFPGLPMHQLDDLINIESDDTSTSRVRQITLTFKPSDRLRQLVAAGRVPERKMK